MNFTVITASYNSGTTIKKTIESVLNQTYSDFEYIIVDGNSDDNTLNVIKSFEPLFKKKGITYKWISEKDSGIYDAWNKALNLATGNWISFLGSDDYYLDNALMHYAQKADASKHNYLTSKVAIINKDFAIQKIIGEPFNSNKFKRYMTVAHVGSFHHKSLYEKHGNYNISYKIAGDYEFLLRALPDLKCCFIDVQTAHMLGDGVSQNNIKKVFLETYYAKVKNKVRLPIFAKIDYLIGWLKIIFKKTILEIFN